MTVAEMQPLGWCSLGTTVFKSSIDAITATPLGYDVTESGYSIARRYLRAISPQSLEYGPRESMFA